MPGGSQSNGDLARALRMTGCAGNTPINQMINQAMYIYDNKKHVKCVILGLIDTCFHRTVERRKETTGRRGGNRIIIWNVFDVNIYDCLKNFWKIHFAFTQNGFYDWKSYILQMYAK